MTGHMLKKRMRSGGTAINLEFYVGVNHPEDGVGILLQSQMDVAHQAAKGHRFHCRSLSETEALALRKAITKALRVSRGLRGSYDREILRDAQQRGKDETMGGVG